MRWRGLYDDALVWRGASCETYLLPVNALLRDRVVPVAALLALLLLLLHLVGVLGRRRFRRLWLDATLLAGFGLLLYISIETTLLHCFMHGVKLPPCLFGCPH